MLSSLIVIPVQIYYVPEKEGWNESILSQKEKKEVVGFTFLVSSTSNATQQLHHS